MKKNETNMVENTQIFSEIKKIIERAREYAYKAINFSMVEAYWSIGKRIVEIQGGKTAQYGQNVLLKLSAFLTSEFGKGFTVTNLSYMRQFYICFPIYHSLSDKLSWTHYRFLIKVEKDTTREFYLKECVECNWSVRQLERQINSFYYERLLSSKDKDLVRNEIQTLEKSPSVKDFIKDPFVLEFAGLRSRTDFTENELEINLVNSLQDFLLELGKGFSFVARQQRITLDGDHFFIDLVFYNYILKCFVLIDLKVGKLTHQDIGQMDFYVRYYEENIKQENDNPTIGIILSSEKNNAVAKYSVLKDSQHLFSTKYMLYLPSEEQLRKEINRERNLLEIERKFLHETNS